LNEPALAHGTALDKSIRKLAMKNVGTALNQCDCRVLSSKQDAFVWIQRRHDTGLGGAAIIPWNAMSIRRAKEAAGNRQSALEVIDFIDQTGGLSDADKKKLATIPVTNLERLLEDPFAMSKLGIEIRSGDVLCSNDANWTTEALKRVATDIATKRIKVKDIFDKAKREDYIDRVVADIPQRPTKIRAWSLAKGGTAGTGAAAKSAASSGVVHERKMLIPISCKLQIQHARINAIYDELRRKLRVSDVPNSVAVMFRVFVELGVDAFIAKHKIIPKTDKLHSKITAVADYMDQHGIMTKKGLKPVRMAVSNPNELHSTETLNAYVHNASVHPQAGDLKRSWDSLEDFVSKLWA
jgi:hypothetical protein